MTNPQFVTSSSRLTKQNRRTLWLAGLGGGLEAYDFVIFVFFANTIGDLFFPPGIPDWLRQFQTFGIFAVGYLIRPLSGVIVAHSGDLRGRKQMFTFSIFLMALATLGIGLLPTYGTLGPIAPVCLLLLRIGQGAAVGGQRLVDTEATPAATVGVAAVGTPAGSGASTCRSKANSASSSCASRLRGECGYFFRKKIMEKGRRCGTGF